MTSRFYLVDAFAHEPHTGNPAGVCLLDGPADAGWMQSVAAEVNQAETAFIHPIDGGYGLRWFTPTVEVDLCGHATLAAASVLPDRVVRFQTLSGWLQTERVGTKIAMDFPAEPPVECETPFEGIETIWAGKNRMDWFLVLPSEQAVRRFEPDFAEIASKGMRGLCVTAASEGGKQDFVSRFFAPQSGVPEDSVTGSAHCGLACLWAERLAKPALTGYQVSRRGGYVEVERRGDRIRLCGSAVRVVEGILSA